MKKIILPTLLLAGLALLSACTTPTTMVDLENDTGPLVQGFDYRDINQAAQEAVADILASGAVNKEDGSRYVLYVGRILNKTTQNIDQDMIVRQITRELTNSRKVVVTRALDENSVVQQIDQLNNDPRFRQDTGAKPNQLIKPELELKGKIVERNISINARKKQTEYYLMLELVDLESGLTFWEGETRIVKRGANTPNW